MKILRNSTQRFDIEGITDPGKLDKKAVKTGVAGYQCKALGWILEKIFKKAVGVKTENGTVYLNRKSFEQWVVRVRPGSAPSKESLAKLSQNPKRIERTIERILNPKQPATQPQVPSLPVLPNILFQNSSVKQQVKEEENKQQNQNQNPSVITQVIEEETQTQTQTTSEQPLVKEEEKETQTQTQTSPKQALVNEKEKETQPEVKPTLIEASKEEEKEAQVLGQTQVEIQETPVANGGIIAAPKLPEDVSKFLSFMNDKTMFKDEMKFQEAQLAYNATLEYLAKNNMEAKTAKLDRNKEKAVVYVRTPTKNDKKKVVTFNSNIVNMVNAHNETPNKDNPKHMQRCVDSLKAVPEIQLEMDNLKKTFNQLNRNNGNGSSGHE